jgi:hypothetical protein
MAVSSIRNRQSAIRNRTGWTAVSILLVAGAVVGRVGMIAWPFLNDSGLYAYMGKMVARGGTLYVDFYENKLPGAALICSAFWRVFGTWWPGYVLAQLALALVGAGLLARMVGRRPEIRGGWLALPEGEGTGAALATFLYAVVFLNFCWAVFTGFQLEPVQAFFEILAAAAAVDGLRGDGLAELAGDALAVGLAAGTAAMLKPSGVAVAGAFLFCLAMERAGWRRWMVGLIGTTAGVAIPSAVTAVYSWQTGIVQYLPGVWEQIRLYAAATPFEWFMGVKLAIVAGVLGFPAVMRVVGGRKRGGKRGRGGSRVADRPATRLSFPKSEAGRPLWGARRSSLISFAVAWFVVDLIGVVAQRRMYLYHFYPLIPPAALLYGLMPGRASVVAVAVGLAPIVALSLAWHGTDVMHLSRGWQRDAVSAYVGARTHGGEAVYADQIGRLLIETDREPGSRYGTFFYFINYDTAPQDYCRGMLADFERRRPVYVVIGKDAAAARGRPAREPEIALCPVRRDNFLRAGKRFDAYVNQHYVLETTIGGNDVYRRKADAPAAGTATATVGE